MDESLRHSERAARTGDPGAVERHRARLLRCGVEPLLPVDTRVQLGLFDTFSTRLRDDIVEEARRTAEEKDRFSQDVNLDPACCPVDLMVNGVRLVDLVGGGYSPHLPAHAVYLPTRHLLGEPYAGPGAWACPEDGDKTLLLYCSCGDDLCGRLVARITTSERTVVWSELEHRPSSSARPLPEHATTFVFSRKDYEEALRDPPPLPRQGS